MKAALCFIIKDNLMRFGFTVQPVPSPRVCTDVSECQCKHDKLKFFPVCYVGLLQTILIFSLFSGFFQKGLLEANLTVSVFGDTNLN